MKDERIIQRLGIVKRNNLIIIFSLALLSLIYKLIFVQAIVAMLTEIFVLIVVIITFIINAIIKSKEELVDERVYQKILRIYNYGFNITVGLGVIIYFVSSLFYVSNTIVSPNLFVNSAIFICLLLSFTNFRKNGMSFNYKFIENCNKQYYFGVIKRVLYLLAYTIIVGLVVFILSIIFTVVANVEVLLLSILISFITFAIQYFLFSIYEKLHYDESVEMDEGKLRYITRKVLYIFVLITLFRFYALLIDSLWSFSHLENNFLHKYALILELLELGVKIQGIDFAVLSLISGILIYKSIIRINLKFLKYKKLYLIAIWVSFVFGILNWVYRLGVTMLGRIYEFETFIKIVTYVRYLNFTFLFISIFVGALIYIFMLLNNLKVRNTYLALLIFQTLGVMVTVGIIPVFGNLNQDPTIHSVVFNCINVFGLAILNYIVIYKLTRAYEIKEFTEELL